MVMGDKERLERIDILRTRFGVSHARANEVLAAADWDLVQAAITLEGEKSSGLLEEFKVQGKELADKLKELFHQGNISRVVVKEEGGREVLNLPVNGALAVAVLAPVLAALGAVVALAAQYTVVVEKGGTDPERPQ